MMYVWTIAAIAGVLFFWSCRQPGKEKLPFLADSGFRVQDGKMYYHDQIMEGMLPATCQVLDENYIKDARSVFFVRSYRESRDYFTSRKHRVHKIKDADPATFLVLGYAYAKDKNQAYYHGSAFPVRDVVTYTVTDENISKDKVSAYYKQKEIRGSHGPSFERIDRYHAKDDTSIYYLDPAMEETEEIRVLSHHPFTFRILEHPFTKDNTRVWYMGQPVKDADPVTFRVLGHGYCLDADHVFFQDQIVKGADAGSIHPLPENETFTEDGAFAMDKEAVYFRDKKIMSADKESFTALSVFYSKDKNRVFYRETILKEADPSSFTLFPHDMGDADAKDKRHYYHKGKIVR